MLSYPFFSCDNNGVVAQFKKPRNHKSRKHIKQKYHLIREIVRRRKIVVTKVVSIDIPTDPFTKVITSNIFQLYVDKMGVRCDIIWT